MNKTREEMLADLDKAQWEQARRILRMIDEGRERVKRQAVFVYRFYLMILGGMIVAMLIWRC